MTSVRKTLAGKVKAAPRKAVIFIIEHPLGAGLALLVATIAALIVANSPLSVPYHDGLKAYIGPLSVEHWINDGLMAVFFLLIGMELKREMLDGDLSSWDRRILPGLAATGGVMLPALIFAALKWDNATALRGWAIPAATDIAFALGVLSLLGPRVPVSLRLFLTTIAVLDDLAAIVIIALFYTAELSLLMLALAGVCLAVLLVLKRLRIAELWPYLGIGLVLWFLVLKSGVHATIAGVVLAMTIPYHVSGGRHSPLLHLEHALQPWVSFVILPIFAFANAGVSLSGITFASLLEPLTLGIAAGLFFGKQIGVFGSVWLAEKAGLVRLPEGASWLQLYGVAVLCGIGFTMSLFIGLLAFGASAEMQAATKIGVLTGSFLSAVLGYAMLYAGGRSS